MNTRVRISEREELSYLREFYLTNKYKRVQLDTCTTHNNTHTHTHTHTHLNNEEGVRDVALAQSRLHADDDVVKLVAQVREQDQTGDLVVCELVHVRGALEARELGEELLCRGGKVEYLLVEEHLVKHTQLLDRGTYDFYTNEQVKYIGMRAKREGRRKRKKEKKTKTKSTLASIVKRPRGTVSETSSISQTASPAGSCYE